MKILLDAGPTILLPTPILQFKFVAIKYHHLEVQTSSWHPGITHIKAVQHFQPDFSVQIYKKLAC